MSLRADVAAGALTEWTYEEHHRNLSVFFLLKIDYSNLNAVDTARQWTAI
jgi:hypothetical protein